MKSILYVGATLMIGASIYGFVDYKQTSSKKEFKKMYTEEKTTEPEVVTVIEKNGAVNNDASVKEKNAIAKKQTNNKNQPDEEIVSINPIADEDVLTTTDPVTIEKTEVNIAPTKRNVKVRKARKFDSRLFSRAPLREEYVEIKLPEPVKADVKKTEEKVKEN